MKRQTALDRFLLTDPRDVGCEQAMEFLHIYVELMAADVGDIYPRQVQFFPASGRVRVRQLRAVRDVAVADREQHYLKRLANDPIKGEVELF